MDELTNDNYIISRTPLEIWCHIFQYLTKSQHIIALRLTSKICNEAAESVTNVDFLNHHDYQDINTIIDTFPRLNSLKIHSCQYVLFSRLPQLTHLSTMSLPNIHYLNIHLPKLTKLTSLSIMEDNRFTIHAIANILSSQLTSLTIHGTDTPIGVINQFTNLTYLDITHNLNASQLSLKNLNMLVFSRYGKINYTGMCVMKNTQGVYRGRLTNGLPDDYGVFKHHSTYEQYSGEYKNGLRHGRGIYISDRGVKSSGEWYYGSIVKSTQTLII